MNYTLHQLKIFLEIAESKSITKTAEKLFLTQPAVSIQLKNFQDQFSIPLTEIIGRQLYVTDFGLEIAEAARKILQEVEKINYKTMSFKGMMSGKLSISVVSTGKYVIPFFLSEFINLHKGIDLIMDVTNKSKVVRSLEKNEVDFALVSVLPKKMQVNHLDLMPNQLFFVGKGNSMLDKNIPKKELFSTLPLIYREKGSATRDAMEKFISSDNFQIRKKIELTSNEAVKQAVVANLGFSIMPLIGIKNELQNKELEIIPIKGLPLISTWRLIWLKSKKLSPVALSYLEHVRENKNTIIDKNFDWIKSF